MLRTTLVVILLAGFAAAQDSPYVALAKRTNRKASKTRVITNETLARARTFESTEGEQATTTPAQATTAVAPAEEATTARPASVNATTGRVIPAVEPLIEQTYLPAGTNITPVTSATNTMATQGRTIEPQSTMPIVEAASTARNIEPTGPKPPEPQPPI